MALVEMAWASGRYLSWPPPLPPSCALLKPFPEFLLGSSSCQQTLLRCTNSSGFRLLRVLVCLASLLTMVSEAPPCFLVSNTCPLVGVPT